MGAILQLRCKDSMGNRTQHSFLFFIVGKIIGKKRNGGNVDGEYIVKQLSEFRGAIQHKS